MSKVILKSDVKLASKHIQHTTKSNNLQPHIANLQTELSNLSINATPFETQTYLNHLINAIQRRKIGYIMC